MPLSSTEASRPTALTPLDDRVSSLLGGYSITDVHLGLDFARFQYLSNCLLDKGFTIQQEPPPTRAEDYLPRGYVRQAIVRVKAGRISSFVYDPAVGDSPEYSRADAECTEAAATSIQDPLQELSAWIATKSGEINQQVLADPRLASADQAMRVCLAKSGVTVEELSQLEVGYNRQADEILNAYRKGSLDETHVIAQLETLADTVDARLSDAYVCTDIENAVVYDLMSAAQEQFLETYGPMLAELAGKIRKTVEDLMSPRNN